MLASLRSLSKSKVGTGIAVVFLLLILMSFAMSDITGSSTFGLSKTTIAEAGKRQVSDADVNQAAERTVAAMRAQNPAATYADLAPQFAALVDSLVDDMALQSFGDRNGFNLSKRLVDAEIVKIPGTKGLDGKFSDAAYQSFLQQRQLTDGVVRKALTAEITRRMILVPVAVEARVPTGVARLYAAMQLEKRQGEIGLIPASAFRTGLAPSSGDLTSYYQQNARRYIVPEQRILRFAAITADTIARSPPSEAEIATYYRNNQASFAGRDQRQLVQLVARDKATADTAAAAARAGQPLPGGIALGLKDRAALADAAGNKVAAAVFAAAQGAVVGPIQSDLGWHVVKVVTVTAIPARTLDQARGDIVAALAAQKAKTALADAFNKVQSSLDGGANFADAVKASGLMAVVTPPLTVDGKSFADPAYKLPAGYDAAVKSGFELAAGDEPVIESLADKSAFVLVGLERAIPSAPAPLASIIERVRSDWIERKANDRAKAAATDIAAKVARGVPVAQAMAAAGVALPPALPVSAQRYQMDSAKGSAAAALKILFGLGEGKSRMIADPSSGGFIIIRTNKIIPADGMSNTAAVAQASTLLSRAMSDEYAQQFLVAVRKDVKLRRNEAAIAAARSRLTAPPSGQ